MGREAGVEVHGGGCALKLAGGGSRPGVPMEAAMAARWMARRTRGGAASRLYRRRVGEGSHGFVAKGPPTLMRAYDVLASAGAPVAGRHRADRRADGSVVRATSESAARGRGCPEGAAHGPGSQARLGVRVRRCGGSDVWQRSGARGAVASATSRVPARTVAVPATLTRFFSQNLN
jgi:hypothetical protein